MNQNTIIEVLNKIPSPIDNKDILSSGIVKNVEVIDSIINIELELNEKLIKFKSGIESTIIDALKRQLQLNESDIKIKTTKKQIDISNQVGGIGKVNNIIAVASGKGGVGKSTITANLAISLAKKGYKVGLIDADIFGPSIPKMFGVEGETPYARKEGDRDLVIPIEKYGIKLLSIGFFIKASDAVAWRGPVASSALKQLINDGDWGELDFILFDLPPGTSDIQLTLVQSIAIDGAIIVSTPQDIALIDAIKGIDFFRKDKINVPILGLIENMSWFTPEELPNNKYYIFGQGGCKQLSEDKKIPFLGHIPIVQNIREGGDKGIPAAEVDNSMLQNIFFEITDNVIQQLEIRKSSLPPTEILRTN